MYVGLPEKFKQVCLKCSYNQKTVDDFSKSILMTMKNANR